MKSIFISCVDSGWHTLKALLEMGGKVSAIFTLQNELMEGSSGFMYFDTLALEYSIPLYKVRNINNPEHIQKMQELQPDVIFIIGWSQLIKKEILQISKIGCIGMHPTLLPKNRGRAAIPWTIIKGLKQSGATMFFIDEGTDSGDIIDQKKFTIDDNETATTLYTKVRNAFVSLMQDNFQSLVDKTYNRIKQNEADATYWEKRTPSDGVIDWKKPIKEIYALIRGVTHPYPGAFTYYLGKKMFIWEAEIVDQISHSQQGYINKITTEGFTVAVADGTFLIKKVQFENQSEKNAFDFCKLHNINIGESFIISKNILIIAPHPDDEVLGLGGTILKHAEAGDIISLCIMTEGSTNDYDPKILTEKKKEVHKAAEILHINKIFFCGFPAAEMDTIPQSVIIKKINKIIKEIKPTIIYLPFFGDIHSDHKITFNCSMVSVRPLPNSSIRKILCYETSSETEWGNKIETPFIPNVYNDISKYIDKKLEALSVYKTELKESPHPRSTKAIKIKAQYRGNQVSLPAAEAFILIYDIIDV